MPSPQEEVKEKESKDLRKARPQSANKTSVTRARQGSNIGRGVKQALNAKADGAQKPVNAKQPASKSPQTK